jgi:hypothetical protein
MTGRALVADLRARDVRLTVAGDRVHVDAPRGVLTAADRAALRRHKAQVLRVLGAETARPTSAAGDWADGVSDGPCGLCRHQPLAEVHDWPTAGERRWLCLACADRSVPSLEAVYASLSVDERGRLLDEARAGDPLARLLLTVVPVSGAA